MRLPPGWEGSMRGDRIADLLNVLAYDPDRSLFLMADEAIGFAFVCQPLVGGNEAAARGLQVLMNSSWPAGTTLSFSLMALPDVFRYLRRAMELRCGQSDRLFVEMTERMHEFLLSGVDEPLESSSRVRVRDVVLVVSIKLPIDAPEPTDTEIEQAHHLRLSVEQQLGTIGFHPQALTADGWLRLMTVIFNMSPDGSWRQEFPVEVEYDRPLSAQVAEWPSTLSVDRDGLWFGEHTRVAVLSPKRWPQAVYFGHAGSYLGDLWKGVNGIRESVILTGTVYFPEEVAKKRAFDRRLKIITHQYFGPMKHFVRPLRLMKEDLDEVDSAITSGDRPIEFSLTMVLFGRSEEELVQAVGNVRTYFGTLQFAMLRNAYYHHCLFFQALPLAAERRAIRESFRYKTMATRQCLPLLPIMGDWKGTGSPLMTFVSRNGQLMSFSPFDSATNYNAVVAAESGAGKSVLANEAIAAVLSAGGQVFVIDVGRSYEKQCLAYGGDFVSFESGSGVCLNPFPLVSEDDPDDFEEQMDMLSALLAAMAAPTEKLSDLQMSEMKRILRETWAEFKQKTLIDEIALRLREHEDQRLRDVGYQMYSFTTKGEYGKFFNGDNNVSFRKPFTVLELEELNGRQHLQQVVLLLLIWQVQSVMYLGDRSKIKVVLIDEAWHLLAEEGTGVTKFIETGYRRARKYKGSMWTVTQNLLDLTEKTGRVIIANSANVVMLRQKPEVIEKLKQEKQLAFPSNDWYDWLKTVHTIPGAYSELLFSTNSGMGIGRLIVDKFRLLLYSTRPDEVAAIQACRDKGLDVASAIKTVLASQQHRFPLPAAIEAVLEGKQRQQSVEHAVEAAARARAATANAASDHYHIRETANAS